MKSTFNSLCWVPVLTCLAWAITCIALSIPFVGFRNLKKLASRWSAKTFNSLCWVHTLPPQVFQPWTHLSIPFVGFFRRSLCKMQSLTLLSIPFVGFPLSMANWICVLAKTFNSLCWVLVNGVYDSVSPHFPFNSLCWVLDEDLLTYKIASRTIRVSFQFPLLGSLLS